MTSSMFDLYTKTVNIDGTEYKLRPLSGRFLPRFYKVAAAVDKIKKEDPDGENFISLLSEELVGDIHVICLQTLVASYPDTPETQLDAFVSQNLWSLFQSVIAVNTKSKE